MRGEKRAPAGDHRLSRLRLDGIDPGKDLPDDSKRREDGERDDPSAPVGRRGHAAAPPRNGCRPMFEAEMAEQLVLDGDHVRQQQAVGVARPRCSDGDVVDDRARAHGDDPVRKRQGLVDIVGDEQHGRNGAAGLFPEIEQDVLELAAGDIVERAERLVQEQHFSAIGEDGRDGDPLQHAAGKLARPGPLDMRKADPAQIVARDLPTFARRDATALEAVFDIVDDAQPRKHAVALKDHSALAAGSVDLLAVDDDGAGRRGVEAGDHLQERALAAARRADQTDELAFRYDERHVVDRVDPLSVGARIVSPDMNELDHATIAVGRHLALLLNGRQNSMRRIAR